MYISNNKSFADIASAYGTYANKIRRDAKKFGINIRNKSDAQKNALNTGKHKHPTRGTNRSEETKNKIGNNVMRSWDSLTDSELAERKKKAKINWDNLDDNIKENMQKAAVAAVRESSKKGSKLEIFIFNSLLSSGIKAEFHKEQTLVNTKLQIDIFLPTLDIAIEVDGPSHFEPVWGTKSLQRNISYDNKKNGLIIGRGWHLIRIKQTKDFSKARANKIVDKLLSDIKKCQYSNNSLSLEIKDTE